VGSGGNFVSEGDVAGQSLAGNYGVAVVATGGTEYRPTEYLYGQDERVKTHLEFDALLDGDPQAAKAAESVVFIQCVGSREPGRPYCSRVCCTHSIESAIELKKLNPDMNVFIFNRDIRTYGLREDLYTEARRLGVIFVRYEADKKPQVVKEGGALYVTGDDHILHTPLRIKADYLVLATAIVPNQTRELVDLYKCSVGADGFLTEAHPKLRPVDMSVDGLFLAGLCHYPKPVDEAVAQAQAAALADRARAAGFAALSLGVRP
jgi:heterodisulfide reductase subunit A